MYRFFLIPSVVICLFSFSASAAVPTAAEYVGHYNSYKGWALRDHARATNELNKEFNRVLQNEYHNDLQTFYTQTLGSLLERAKNRSRYKVITDKLVIGTTYQCIQTLHRFVLDKATEVGTWAAQHQGDAELPPISDEVLHALVERALADDAVRAQIAGIMHLAEGATLAGDLSQSTFIQSSIQYTASIAIGVALYVYGPAYLMAGAEIIFPYVYTQFFGAIPAVRTAAYLGVYLPAKMHFMGQAYTHSTTILSGVWLAGSTLCWATARATTGILSLTHRAGVGLYHLGTGALTYMRTTPAQLEAAPVEATAAPSTSPTPHSIVTVGTADEEESSSPSSNTLALTNVRRVGTADLFSISWGMVTDFFHRKAAELRFLRTQRALHSEGAETPESRLIRTTLMPSPQ